MEVGSQKRTRENETCVKNPKLELLLGHSLHVATAISHSIPGKQTKRDYQFYKKQRVDKNMTETELRMNELYDEDKRKTRGLLPEWMSKPQAVGAATLLGAMVMMNQKPAKPSAKSHHATAWEDIPVLHDDEEASSLSSSSLHPASPPASCPTTSTSSTPPTKATVGPYYFHSRSTKSRVKPVFIGGLLSPVASPAVATKSSTEEAPRIPAAMMRNLQSKERKRQPQLVPTVIRTSTPTAASSNKEESPGRSSAPVAAFKVVVKKSNSDSKGTSEGTVYRIRCQASASVVQQAIADRLGVEKENVTTEYVDREGDTCVLSSDEDVREAIRAATSLIRLSVTVQSSSIKDQLVGLWNKSASWW